MYARGPTCFGQLLSYVFGRFLLFPESYSVKSPVLFKDYVGILREPYYLSWQAYKFITSALSLLLNSMLYIKKWNFVTALGILLFSCSIMSSAFVC